MRCYAYSFAKSFNYADLLEYLKLRYTLTSFTEVEHFNFLNDVDSINKRGDVFIFEYGAFVSWGLSEEQENLLRNMLFEFTGEKLGGEDYELYHYSYGDKGFIRANNIVLPNDHLQTKLACSFGIAQSAKLGGFEDTIQNLIEITKNIPENLAKTGKISLGRLEIQRLVGKIFVERASINLHLDVLDTPNFFWDKSQLEPLHHMVTEDTDQDKRVQTLNQRLQVLQDFVDILSNELNNQHSSKLEWIIIILIAVEVLMVMFKSH